MFCEAQLYVFVRGETMFLVSVCGVMRCLVAVYVLSTAPCSDSLKSVFSIQYSVFFAIVTLFVVTDYK